MEEVKGRSDLKFHDLRPSIASATGQTVLFEIFGLSYFTEHTSFALVKIRNKLQKIEMAISWPILILET